MASLMLFIRRSKSELESWFLGMMTGRIIDQSDYMKTLARLVGPLVKFGDAILVGRGTNIIVGHQKGVHLRIIGSKTQRAKNLSKEMGIPQGEAQQLIEKSDNDRNHFIKKSFGVDINDPSYYDLIINTDYLSIDDAVDLIFAAYIKKERLLK